MVVSASQLPSPIGTLLAVPIPAEYTEDGAKVQLAVDQAVQESVLQGIDKRGSGVTPWLLNRVYELTKGLSLDLSELSGRRSPVYSTHVV